MKVIGLTGGIGSGKSTVAQFLAELGVPVIDTDRIGHEVLRRNTEVCREVVAAFGQQVLNTDGDIDRKKLGDMVFGNHKSLLTLNRIMHPRIYERVKAQLEAYRRQGKRVVVLEVPLLVEAGWTSLVGEVWVTAASEATVLRRLAERTGLSESESRARLRSQMRSEGRVRHADVVIDTDCDLDELKARVKGLWHRLSSGGR